MDKLKVLLINQVPEVNNKYTFSLARGLQKNGVNITVCGIEDDDVSSYTDVAYVGIFGSYSKTNGYINKVVSYKRSWDRVFKLATSEKYDLVHVQWYIFSPLDWYYHKKLRAAGIKVVTTIHDLLPFNKKIYDEFYHKRIYSKSDLVITQAKMNIEVLIKQFDVSPNKIVYIPHGHYMEYAETISREDSCRYLNLPVDKKIILFFGQIKKVKGVDVLIRSMKTVIDKHPNAYCVIAGKVWKDDFSTYTSLIKELGLENCIRTDIKYIDDGDIKYYFNACDIVALPYLQIYQSGVVLLGVAYKKPTVATTEGEFLTLFEDKKTSLLVKAGDSRELADAICWYLDNPLMGTEIAESAYNDLNIRLSWDKISLDLKNNYELVLRGQNG